MFPQNTINYFKELTGVSSETITSNTSTILSININQSGIASESIVKCGSVDIAKSYAKEYQDDNLFYICPNTLSIEKTNAGDKSFFSITYVPQDLSTGISPVLPETLGGFFIGDTIIIFLLSVLISLVVLRGFIDTIFGIKIKRK
jgi:hypothetical protein